MEDENFRIVDGKKMRKGFTTGACAAAAATAAAKALLTGTVAEIVLVTLPNGSEVPFEPISWQMEQEQVCCGIRKDAGDDPDVTHGLEIVVCCKKISNKGGRHIEILGGVGVGIITRRGFKRPVGAAAINPGPLAMIETNVRNVLADVEDWGTLHIIVSVPKGAEVAKKTFNPQLGIEGGISILGTTGIVEPMSQKALVDSIYTCIDARKAQDPEKIILCPGNYGAIFAQSTGILQDEVVKCSNFIGAALDYITYCGFKKVVLIGHIGKLVKVAGGIMDTHSRTTDCRMEILCAHSAVAGATTADCQRMMQCVTTEEALEILREIHLEKVVIETIAERILYYIQRRLGRTVSIELRLFGDGWEVVKEYESAREVL